MRDVEHPGLNLTRQTLNGVLKYPWLRDVDKKDRAKKWGAYGADQEAFAWVRQHDGSDAASIEARIMDWADDVTYAVHDMDDFYRVGLIPLENLRRPEEALVSFKEYVTHEAPSAASVVDDVFTLVAVTGRYEGRIEERARLRALGSFLITRYIEAFSVVNGNEGAEIKIDDQRSAEVTVLKRLIWFYVIDRPSLSTVQHGQRRLIRDLAKMYLSAAEKEDPRLFPPVFRQRLEAAQTEDARRRVAIDMVAGMTEDSALEVHRRATGVATGSLLSAPQI